MFLLVSKFEMISTAKTWVLKERTRKELRDRSLFIAWGGGDFGGESLDFEENKRGVSVVTENPKGGIPENFGRIQTKTQMLKIMHKILWQRKRNELQGISGCLSTGDAVLFKYVNIGACRGNRDSVTACAAKNNLHSGIHTDWNALDLNCHFYVVEVTKQMYVFSRLWLYSSKGHQ